jgi:hypothetical protein
MDITIFIEESIHKGNLSHLYQKFEAWDLRVEPDAGYVVNMKLDNTYVRLTVFCHKGTRAIQKIIEKKYRLKYYEDLRSEWIV